MEFDLNKARYLARTNQTNELLAALLITCTDCVRDMQSDFLRDADYVKNQGMPSKAMMIDLIHDWFFCTLPMMLEEEMPEEIQMKEGERPLEFLVRGFLTEMISADQTMIKLEYQPK